VPNQTEIPPPYAFEPLKVLLTGRKLPSKKRTRLDVDDNAVQWVNVLLERLKVLFLTVVSPVNTLPLLL
jgi:hypothetical protein